jgi:hypothetical protein
VQRKQKRDQNTLDEAAFVRDVDKSAYHHLSQSETNLSGKATLGEQLACIVICEHETRKARTHIRSRSMNTENGSLFLVCLLSSLS